MFVRVVVIIMIQLIGFPSDISNSFQINWGSISKATSLTTSTFTFPIGFSSSCFCVFISFNGTFDSANISVRQLTTINHTKTQFTYYLNNTHSRLYLALGK